jgi:hypothetical protein
MLTRSWMKLACFTGAASGAIVGMVALGVVLNWTAPKPATESEEAALLRHSAAKAGCWAQGEQVLLAADGKSYAGCVMSAPRSKDVPEPEPTEAEIAERAQKRLAERERELLRTELFRKGCVAAGGALLISFRGEGYCQFPINTLPPAGLPVSLSKHGSFTP